MKTANTFKISLVTSFVVFALFVVFTNTIFAFSEHGSRLDINPNYPSPNSTVTARFMAPGVDINTALITWRVNGEVIQQAYGKNIVKFEVGKIGTIYKISVFAKDAKNKKASKSEVIQVSDATIIWEGKTYTPPFYKGRAMQSPGSSISLLVIPEITNSNGVMYDKDDLFYEWMTNNSTIPESAGKGMYYTTLKNPKPMETFKVVVKIKDKNGDLRTVKKAIIPVTQPMIKIYEDNPFVGVRYDKSIENVYNIRTKESTIMAEPFYMSVENRVDKNLTYSWIISNVEYNNKGTITLGSEGTGFGSTNLSLTIQNDAYWLQNARKSLRVEFGQKEQYNWDRNINPETTPL